MQENSIIKKNILQFLDNKGITPYKFYKDTGITRGILSQNNGISEDNTLRFLDYYPEVNAEWLLTGKGEMLKNNERLKGSVTTKKNLIPLYNDVDTIGGQEMGANMEGVSKTTEYIDAGDWFKDVTAAIRHYGSSMVEYPNGCILALRRVNNVRGIVWGRNYVIETRDFRVTKRMQTCPDDDSCIMAYSTNTEVYQDGRLVHEPFKIYKEDIMQIFLVIGRVVKEYSSDPIFTIK